jgi:tetratricopeptide (TPR) repeat protein
MTPAKAAQHLHDRGGGHKLAGRLAQAEADFRAALALEPGRADTRWALGTVLLALGRYAEGFPLLEARHEVAAFVRRRPNLPYPEWTGCEVAGRRILIWPEQGFGDQIQSARFRLKTSAWTLERVATGLPASLGLDQPPRDQPRRVR